MNFSIHTGPNDAYMCRLNKHRKMDEPSSKTMLTYYRWVSWRLYSLEILSHFNHILSRKCSMWPEIIKREPCRWRSRTYAENKPGHHFVSTCHSVTKPSAGWVITATLDYFLGRWCYCWIFGYVSVDQWRHSTWRLRSRYIWRYY